MKQIKYLSIFIIALILISYSNVLLSSIETKAKLKTKINTKAKLPEDFNLDNFNLPGFSDKTIGNIIKKSELEEEGVNSEESENTKEDDSSLSVMDIQRSQVQRPLNNNDDEELSNLSMTNNVEDLSLGLNTEEENENDDSELNMIETEEGEGLVKPYLKEGNVKMKDWFSISSISFGDDKKFPQISTESEKFNIEYVAKNFKRKNPMFHKKKGEGIPDQYSFWFRLNKYFLWYTFNKSDINVIGRIQLENVYDIRFFDRAIDKKKKEYCFNAFERSKESWTICQKNKKKVTKWFCTLLKFTKIEKHDLCDPKKYKAQPNPEKIAIKTITQPVIIIPTASHNCNSGWSYGKKGEDWECLCKEGLEQSPIDLPPPSKGIETDAKPVFEYEKVEVKMSEDYSPAKVTAGDNNVIRYEQEALRIKHPNFGKIITLDGAVYTAQEIVFHTPSEHTINGAKFDMEMQIVHYGKTVGDTLKSVILSFLFRAKPGSFNKFIDKLDFFDLPNPINKARELSKALYIPEILQDSNDEDVSFMLPFSFYTYQGSHTAPPCAEKTIHYVASNPIELSNTTLEMFKESLRMPDTIDEKGNAHVSNSLLENNRGTMPLNGRPIFHYDHTINCPTFRKGKEAPPQKGHYEKIQKETTEYFYVNGDSPSGIPNSFVVTNKEALGHLAKYKEKKKYKNKKK